MDDKTMDDKTNFFLLGGVALVIVIAMAGIVFMAFSNVKGDTQDRFEVTFQRSIKDRYEENEIKRLRILNQSPLKMRCHDGDEKACMEFSGEVALAYKQCRDNILPWQSELENQILCDKWIPVIHNN